MQEASHWPEILSFDWIILIQTMKIQKFPKQAASFPIEIEREP